MPSVQEGSSPHGARPPALDSPPLGVSDGGAATAGTATAGTATAGTATAGTATTGTAIAGTPRHPEGPIQRPAAVWREPQLLVIAIMVAGLFFSRIGALGLQGEETRRAQVAAEILQTGDWVVPRQQGTVYVSRPPLGSWPIAALALARGRLDTLSIRLPTVTAILLTSLMIYAYARNLMGRLGALVAAIAYPTMGQVLQIGRVAETEGLFTLLVSGSLLLWHWGYLRAARGVGGGSGPPGRGWPAALTWSLGYGFAALAGLTKGPQGPIYFVSATWVYLALVRDRAFFFRPAHLAGIATLATILGGWQVAYTWRTDWQAARQIWMQNAAHRFTLDDHGRLLGHLASYPLEVAACMLPWSFCLVQWFNPRFLRSLSKQRREVGFLIVALAVSFPTVWLAAGARGRYYMPLYPIVAVLIGLTAERCFLAAAGTMMRRGWQSFAIGMAAAFLTGGGVFVLARTVADPRLAQIAQGTWLTVLISGAALLSATWLLATRGSRQIVVAQASMLLCAAMTGLFYVGPIINIIGRNLQDVAGAVAAVRRQLPEDARLVSFGIVSHKFRHHYGRPIPMVPWSEATGRGAGEVEYFCFDGPATAARRLPWNWEKVAEVPLDRYRGSQSPEHVVTIGRRVPAARVSRRASSGRRPGR